MEKLKQELAAENQLDAEAETMTVDTNGENNSEVPKAQIVKKYKSDLDVLQQEKIRTLGDSQKLIELRQKQTDNPWDLDEERLKSEIDFLDKGISCLKTIEGEFDAIIDKKEKALKALSEDDQ